MMRRAAIATWVSLLALCACSEDGDEEGGSGGSAGNTINVGGKSSSSGGSVSTAGTSSSSGGTSSSSGGTSSAGTSSSSGGTSSGGSTSAGSGGQGASGTQPIGGLCANDGNCSQASGATKCCVGEGCASPCICLEADACPSASYLPCESAADCDQYGGGKVCCDAGSMQYCTKPSGCLGDTLP